MKHRLFTCVFIFFACLAVVGQVNQVWWSKGRVLHVNPVAGIDSVTYGQFVNADTFLIVIDRASRRIVYDTIDEHVPGMVFHDTIHTTHTVYLNPGRRIGVFSVAKNKQVSFSQGNLQYIQSRDKWQFANTQYEYMGNRHFVNGQLADTIEYFGWSGKNSKAPWGISLSINLSDYKGEFLDWGTNVISGDVANTWRTLSNDELIYLCQKRENAPQLLGLGYIGAISGLIILPDDWVTPEGLQFTPNTNDASLNQYTKEQWAIMENAGAVFIPTTGYFNHKLNNMRGVNDNGYYRVSTLSEDGRQIYLICKKDLIIYSYSGNNNGNLFYAFPVRLVHDTIVPPPAPCETFEVNGVKFNMMCVEGGTFMMGSNEDTAPSNARPSHKVALSDFYIGQTEVTEELWHAVMTPQTSVTSKLPIGHVTWEECQIFVYKLSQLTGLHFRLPTEAEWEYAARGGQKSRGYLYSGSNEPDYIGWLNNMSTGIQPVAQKMPNELGIYDMTGNSWEWCQDGGLRIYKDAVCNPMYDGVSTGHVIRGGSFRTVPERCSNIARSTYGSNKGDSHISMRLVMDAHDYVDLGLSVMWATTNVGATAPEEYGDYFAWGETEPKAKYGWAQYKWGNGENKALTKYCNKAAYGVDGFTDNLTQLLPEDDAAHVNWGGNWRMPTAAEFDELINNCTIEKSTMNGVNGYLLTSKINGNSIFLPMAGYYNFDLAPNKHQGNRTTCYYWSADMMYRNTVYTNINAYNLNSGSTEDGGLIIGNNTRRCGFSIRPVYEAPKTSKQ